jgi:hypothetical protein
MRVRLLQPPNEKYFERANTSRSLIEYVNITPAYIEKIPVSTEEGWVQNYENGRSINYVSDTNNVLQTKTSETKCVSGSIKVSIENEC